MKCDKPLVSIGMPVYNGERFIRHALDSLLAQDCRNFELIISDNASTDRTKEICLEYTTKDKRIQYHRNDTNLGAVKNFNYVFELSNGKYFMWAGDHDLWHPTFISRCVSILEEEPDVVLAYSQTKLIDIDGNSLGIMSDRIDTRGMSVVQRYKYFTRNLTWGNMVYGVVRRDITSQTKNYRNLFFADSVFLSELALRGAFAQIDEPLFYRRKNRPDSDWRIHIKNMLNRMDPKNVTTRRKQSLMYLYSESHLAYLWVLVYAPIRFLEKVNLITFTFSVILSNYLRMLYLYVYSVVK